MLKVTRYTTVKPVLVAARFILHPGIIFWELETAILKELAAGIFDNDIYRLNFFLNELRNRKGQSQKTIPTVYILEPAFDRLAQTVREHVNLDKIYGLMGL